MEIELRYFKSKKTLKKLSLEMLTSNEVLQKSQMKKITDGYGGSCGYRHPRGVTWVGMSMSSAQAG